MPFWNMSLVESTKKWNSAELTKTVCTPGPGAHYCAREQISTLCWGTGTVVTCSRRSDSGARRDVRERGKNKKEERERERGGNGVPLFSPPFSPHRSFFFLLLTSLCAVPTIWTSGTGQHISGILVWVLKKRAEFTLQSTLAAITDTSIIWTAA